MHEKDLVKKFYEHCNWAYKSWRIQKLLFEQNKNVKSTIEKSTNFFTLLNHITLEYSLIQIVKLHDNKKMCGKENLSLNYLFDFIELGDLKCQAEKLNNSLLDFVSKIKDARNQVIAHSDLKVSFSDEIVGGFKEGEDVEYFENLEELIGLFGRSVGYTPLVFDDLVDDAVLEFLDLLKFSVPERVFDKISD